MAKKGNVNMETTTPTDSSIVRDIVALTKDLIRFKSTHSRPEQIRDCARFIQRWFGDRGIDSGLVFRNGVPSISTPANNGSIPLLLMSHIDVVEGDDQLFEPVEKKGRLYGRGAIDDKYAVALCMVLLKNRFARSSSPPAFGLLITGDEEVGGRHGARAALGERSCDFCIALDGGRVDKIVVKEKGVLQLELVALGRAAHGARPWLGENAIEKLMDDCRKVNALFAQGGHPEHWHRTANLSRFTAGTSVNQVPSRAEATFDIRYTEKDDVDDLIRRIRSAVSATVSVTLREPLFIGAGSPYLDRLLTLADGSRTGVAHGASDARYLSHFGIEGVVWGADGNNSQHSTDEHVEIDSLSRLYAHLDRFATSLEKQPIR